MPAGLRTSRWLGRMYLVVAGTAIAAILISGWSMSLRAPERLAIRFGDTQLRMLRLARERMLSDADLIQRGLRDLAVDSRIATGEISGNELADLVLARLSRVDLEGAQLQRFSDSGQLLFEIKPSLLTNAGRVQRLPPNIDSILQWARDASNAGRTRFEIQRESTDGSEGGLLGQMVVPVRTEESNPTGAGCLVLRFPISGFMSTYLFQARPVNETYSFVLEINEDAGLDTPPYSIIWHEREPRWIDAYPTNAEAFVRAITKSLWADQEEKYRVIDVPQADGSARAEVVSSLPISFANRRWIVAQSTPYDTTVQASRSQWPYFAALSALTVATVATGFVLLSYQRTQLEVAGAEERRLQLEKVESNYQQLFAQNPAAMFVFGLDGRLAECNHSAERILGMTRSQASGKDVYELFERESIERAWDRLSKTEQLSMIDTRLTLRGDRRSTLVEAWGRRIEDHLILMAQDVEQRRDFDRQMARLRRMESVGSLASTLAHDFNNMLGRIQILVSNLRDDLPPDSPLHGDVANIEEQVEDAGEIVGNLLSSRENVISEEPVHLDRLLAEFISGLRRVAPAGVEIVSEIRPDLPSVWITPISLRRLLDNLCLNAFDAMPYGGTLTIAAKARWIQPEESTDQLRPDHYCVIEVTDTGVGIPQEVLDAIFDPFFTTKSTGKGTGLGLWTIYKIIRRLRGAIHVDSEVGKGTRFTLYLAHTKPTDDIDTPGIELARPNR